MNFINNLKQLVAALFVLWIAVDSCLAQAVYVGANSSNPLVPSPSASDEQNQEKTLAGQRGQKQVDLFTGTFEYSIPIACPPARNGSEPKLALTYSSKGGNGWCGMGWSMDVGYIVRNTKDYGFPMQYSTASPQVPVYKYQDTNGFILNLFGKQTKLLPTGSSSGNYVEYDPEVDTEFVRCFLNTYSTNDQWIVYDRSGNAYYFGETDASRIGETNSLWNNTGGSNYTATVYWALDKMLTPTGDQTTIAYTTYTSPYSKNPLNNVAVPENILYPTRILYNTNINASSEGTCEITFQTSPAYQPNLNRPDYFSSYRWGFRTEMNRILTNIICSTVVQSQTVTTTQDVWQYGLAYGESPATDRLLLTNVVVSGFDANNNPQILLTNTFTYQGSPVAFSAPVHWGNLDLSYPGGNDETLPYISDQESQGSAQSDLIDMDGDGLPDRIVWDSTVTPNQYLIQRNLGNGSFDNSGTINNGEYSFGNSCTYVPAVLMPLPRLQILFLRAMLPGRL